MRLFSPFSTSTYTPGSSLRVTAHQLCLCTQASARSPIKSLPFIPTCMFHSSDLQPCFAPADMCIIFFGSCVQTIVVSDNFIIKKHRLSRTGMFFVCFPQLRIFLSTTFGRHWISGINPFRNLCGAIRKILSSGSKPQPSHWAAVFMY